MHTRYDPATALTFLLAGIGVGTLITLVFAPRAEPRPSVFKLLGRKRGPGSQSLVPYNREIP
jgi:hypothetical protein